jgi:hypothetical protein
MSKASTRLPHRDNIDHVKDIHIHKTSRKAITQSSASTPCSGSIQARYQLGHLAFDNQFYGRLGAARTKPREIARRQIASMRPMERRVLAMQPGLIRVQTHQSLQILDCLLESSPNTLISAPQQHLQPHPPQSAYIHLLRSQQTR